MAKPLQTIFALGVLLLVAAQFVGPKPENPPIDPARTIDARLQPPANVSAILNRACADCHSNNTEWRWYSRVAPASWLQMADVYAGRARMNFSDWASLTPAEQDSNLKGICESTTGDIMPPRHYRPLHVLTSLVSYSDGKVLCDWTLEERKKLQLRRPGSAPGTGADTETSPNSVRGNRAKGSAQHRLGRPSPAGKLYASPGTEVVHLPDPDAQK